MTKREIEEFCREEYRDYMIYSILAKKKKNEKRARVLQRLAEHEKKHYEFWHRLSGSCKGASVGKLMVVFVVLLRMLFGLTFTLKLLERGEVETVNKYRKFAENLTGNERKILEEIIKEEMEHESLLVEEINEAVMRYLGFIVLGLADAIVEITGVHAGFLGVTSNTVMAGIAGLVVGFAAAISMASAAYLQAKQEKTSRSPLVSAMVTGLAYIAAVIILALPYFIMHEMIIAFAASVLAGITLIAGFSFYASVLFERSFVREFLESTALMLGTAMATYFFGEMLGTIFGIRGIFG